MDVSTLSIKDLVDKVNNDLGKDFCDKFRYKRKKLSNSGRASSSSILFKFVDENRDWVINEGGGTEIQFHLYFRDDEIGFGLGFNAQYVPFANLKSPVDYIRPFVNAFLSLKGKGNEKILDLEKMGFSLIEGDWNGLRNITDNEYYLYGKKIQINGGSLSDDDYSQMIECIKKELFNLYVEIWKEKNDMENREEALKKYVSILTDNHNLILTGAPGTGKTYLAKQIAKAMGCTENEIGFVQFHPSYDYTDFVEGLRPKNENGNVGFERKDGVFKEFCARALKGSFNNTTDNFDEVWKRLISLIDDNDYVEIDLLRGKNKIRIELNEYGDGLANRTYENNNYEKGNWVRGQSKFFSKEQCYNIYKGLNGIPSGGHDNYRKAIVNYMKKELGLLEYKEGEKAEGNATPYVFIIDEINRGEISKIFGELFFAIDPGYRGSDKCRDLRTQYANLQESRNVFDEALKITDTNNFGHFFVPENVYVIGTMNDIDRSVESMDFAFRRRFAFVEVTASKTQIMLDDEKAWGVKENGVSQKPADDIIKNIKTRMNNLNNAIWLKSEKGEITGIEGLSSAYHIGASYFLKLANYQNSDDTYDFEKLWENHLKGLLFEYLRGMQEEEREKKIEELHNAYQKDGSEEKSKQPEENKDESDTTA